MTPLIAVIAYAAVQFDSVLVSTQQLANMDGVVIVDARAKEAYDEGHIPGAQNLYTDSLSETRGDVHNLLKPLDELEQILAQKGLSPADPIVIYSGLTDPSDIYLATRLFWILEYLGYEQVAVLDGGLAKWTREGRPVSSGPADVRPLETLKLEPRPEKLATTDELKETKAGGVVIQDLRSPSQYTGADKSGAVQKPGHIPGAQNVHAATLLNEDGTFPSKKVLQESVGPPGRNIVTYCNTGRSASIGYFTWRYLGAEDVAMYDGSMSEWTSHEDTEVIVEENE